VQSPADPGDGRDADPETVARIVCLRLLAAAPRTKAQLAAALGRRNVPEEAIRVVLDRFADVGLIDDDAYARAWVSSRHRGRGLAGRALRHELRTRGVEADVIEAAVAELDPATEQATARSLVRRRLRQLDGVPREVATRRLAGLLARKGYPAGMAHDVVREELAGRDRSRSE